MKAGGRDGVFNTADLKGGAVLEVVDFGPIDWYAASCLDVREDLCFVPIINYPTILHIFSPREASKTSCTVVKNDNLFRLIEVCYVPFVVYTASHVPGTSSVS